jgi:hypothetical protein
MAASQGATIGVLGSGWEAVELAVATGVQTRSMLTFGSAGPLSHVLPRYLSTAVMKRLKQQGIVDVQQRSLVRYVAHHEQHVQQSPGGKAPSILPRLEVHSAKSYDLLDTQRTLVDLLIGTYIPVSMFHYLHGRLTVIVCKSKSLPMWLDRVGPPLFPPKTSPRACRYLAAMSTPPGTKLGLN